MYGALQPPYFAIPYPNSSAFPDKGGIGPEIQKLLGSAPVLNKLASKAPRTDRIETVAGVGNIKQRRRNTRVELLEALGRHFRTKLGRIAFETGDEGTVLQQPLPVPSWVSQRQLIHRGNDAVVPGEQL